MLYSIENDKLKISIENLGAELYSVKSKTTDIEYLWQGDGKYWKDRSPVLFPICGRLYGGKYTYNGKEYSMPIHGFCAENILDVTKHTDTSITFTLTSSDATKKLYPFDFEFFVCYTLSGSTLNVSYFVKNTGKEILPFAYGGHPGFNVPFGKGKFEDYYLEFSSSDYDRHVFSSTCFDTGKFEKLELSNGNSLPLTHDLFDNDAIFIKDEKDVVTLKSYKDDKSITVSFDKMTCLGLWHRPKTDAPYLCIEPWHGIPSDDGKIDDFATKKQMIRLSPDATYENGYSITINE